MVVATICSFGANQVRFLQFSPFPPNITVMAYRAQDQNEFQYLLLNTTKGQIGVFTSHSRVGVILEQVTCGSRKPIQRSQPMIRC